MSNISADGKLRVAVVLTLTRPKKSNDMDDLRYQDAFLAAAEVLERAHEFSASSRSKVPAQRALTVETVMDAASVILWSESGREQPVEMGDADAVRAESVSGCANSRRTPRCK